MNDLKIQNEIKDVLKSMFNAYSAKNIEKGVECVDENVFMFGSGKDEIAKNIKELKKGLSRDFSQADKLKCSIKYLRIWNNTSAACVSGYVTYSISTGNEKNVFNYRYTCVLEKKNKKWKIVSSHMSEPSANQEAGKSYAKAK
ncbi:MAG TPA: nuclear transport factor 2 family protein [bacterium]|nr:nuclear transport factor 2 family protein [bacterium]HPN30488.1 nuclear transport factor 2 family protein [bacterium]